MLRAQRDQGGGFKAVWILRLGLAAATAAAFWTATTHGSRTSFEQKDERVESAPSCPITVTASDTRGPAYEADFGGDSAYGFETVWSPGTDLQVVTSAGPGVELRTTPLPLSELATNYQWQVASQVWAVVPHPLQRSRLDYSDAVRADDWINFIRSNPGVDWMNSLPNVQHITVEAAPYPAIPDWDVNLSDYTTLGDLGAVSARWGQYSSCRGWIRADANNDAKVTLGDIAVVTSHWGSPGVCHSCLSDWMAMLESRIKPYAFKDATCTTPADGSGYADPITLVSRMQGAPDPHLSAHGLPHDITSDPGEIFATLFAHNNTWFYDNGQCAQSELIRGSNPGFSICVPDVCLEDRLHIRAHTLNLLDPQYGGLYVTPMTPHYDEATDECGDQSATVRSKHIIREDFWGDGSASAFTAARDLVVYSWLQSGEHIEVDRQAWGNTNVKQQLCTNELPQADGWVVMLGTCGETPVQSQWCD